MQKIETKLQLEEYCSEHNLTIIPATVNPHQHGGIYSENECVGAYALKWVKPWGGELHQVCSVSWHNCYQPK
tara:strand:- start:142 stop:357 length:216 start_codon:yes stop_codon:yes gene_type:complete